MLTGLKKAVLRPVLRSVLFDTGITFVGPPSTNAINPVINTFEAVDGGSGVPDIIDVAHSYTGSDAILFYAAAGSASLSVTAEELIAGAGGTGSTDFFSFPVNAETDLNDLTPASTGATRIALVLAEVNNGGRSAVVYLDFTSLDGTKPAFASGSPAAGATDAAADDTLIITFSEPVFEGVGDFFIYHDDVLVDTRPAAACTFNGDATVTIPHTDFSGDVHVLWSEGVVIDSKGNLVEANTDDTVWSFSVSTVPAYTENSVTSAGAAYFDGTTLPSGTQGLVMLSSVEGIAGDRRTIFSWDGATGALRVQQNNGASDIQPDLRGNGGAGPGGSIDVNAGTFASGTRLDIISSLQVVDVGGGDYEFRGRVSIFDGTTWHDYTSADTASANGPGLYLPGAVRVFERNSATSNTFDGISNRQAMFSFATGTDVPDITGAALKSDFATATGLTHPSAMQTRMANANAVRQIDLHGNAATMNGATPNDGVMNLTRAGTGDFADA